MMTRRISLTTEVSTDSATPWSFALMTMLATNLPVGALSDQEAEGIRIFHTLPNRVEPEIAEATDYELGFFIPFALFEKTHHAPVPVSGTVWRGNAFKCGDNTSHPHWASWRPVRRVNFHEPDCFDILEFE